MANCQGNNKVKRLLGAFALVLGALTVMQPVRAQLALSPDTVVATRGGVDLILHLVDQEMAKMPPDVRSGYLEDPQRFGRLVDSLLLTRQLAAEAIRQGLTLPADSLAQVEKGSLEYFNKLAGELLKQQGNNKSDADYELLAKELYRIRKARYASEENFTVRHFHADPATQGPIAAKIVAESIRSRVLAGESLAQIKEELAEGVGSISEETNLTLSDVLRGGKVLGQAIRQIGRVPGISEVLEDEAGFHLIELVSYGPSVVPPFDDIKHRMVQELKEEAAINARTTFMKSFSMLDVTLNDSVIRHLPERYRELDTSEDTGAVFH